jgi:hypothetical protein
MWNLYADPDGCTCVYYGDAGAMAAYQQEKRDSQTPDDGTLASGGEGQSMTQEAATRAEFGWGAFGEDGWGPQ